MKTIMKRLTLLAVGLAGIGYAGRAQAADRQRSIHPDPAGSDRKHGDCRRFGRGATFWDDAVSAAQAWVSVDAGSSPLPRRAYAVWTFFDNDCSGCGGGRRTARYKSGRSSPTTGSRPRRRTVVPAPPAHSSRRPGSASSTPVMPSPPTGHSPAGSATSATPIRPPSATPSGRSRASATRRWPTASARPWRSCRSRSRPTTGS